MQPDIVVVASGRKEIISTRGIEAAPDQYADASPRRFETCRRFLRDTTLTTPLFPMLALPLAGLFAPF